ncbi:DUF7344 domain-containing protein (plasmid) [Haloarcula sp. NS06]|uniref:DUF7344 domain-containing protein n=1 Tax=Haloarcula sp. NS06 TaxID=3409688 RepID=UPI003DA761C0
MSDDPDIDELLSILYHSLRATRRRYVIQLLERDNRRVVTTRELARKIASLELKVPEQQATGEPYRNAYNALSQTHLPTLSDAGIIIYDSERQVVTSGDNFDLATLLIDTNSSTVHVFSSLVEGTDRSEE